MLLLACGSPAPVTERADEPAGGEAVESESESESDEAAATEALFVFLAAPEAADRASLAAHLETLADAVAREGSQLTARLRGAAEALRRDDISERDARETVELAIETLWLLIHEREPPDPALCAIGRVLALHGLADWRRALRERFESEGRSLEEVAVAPDCEGLGDSEAEECAYLADLAEAHRVAFAPDGPLARIEAGLQAGPEATAATIEAQLEETYPVRQLISAHPRTTDVEDLGAMCRLRP